jgi:hypothetical protein
MAMFGTGFPRRDAERRLVARRRDAEGVGQLLSRRAFAPRARGRRSRLEPGRVAPETLVLGAKCEPFRG